jgi:trimethylamine---corrinoid protein Co-methyltransferase
MRTARFEVLNTVEVEHIHELSLDILREIGVKVDYKFARDIFRSAGAKVDEQNQNVRLSNDLVQWALEQAPDRFSLFGNDLEFNLEIGGGEVIFAGLGTPTFILDTETGQHRQVTMQDLTRHIQLINGCKNIHNSQMDVWPSDIPMTTIHVEAIAAWARHSKKSFGMGCYGYLPTLDMMQMMSIAVGGEEELRKHQRFFSICSVTSPLQMSQMQVEGMLLCAQYGQPITMAPEAIAGATAPVTLAGLLVQQNANILAHVTLAQIFRPGTPVLYGTVSTIANMRLGTVALGAVETGLISAASAQLARHYGIPIRSVGGTTESKLEDIQAGVERVATLIPAILAGVDFITCAGTLDSTMLESEALLVLDDEICGALLRMARGVEVNEATLAVDLIREINYSGHYLAQAHTVEHFRHEHFIPSLFPREPYEAWIKNGSRSALDYAKERVREILANHEERTLDPQIEQELDKFRQRVSQRPLDDFYAGELEENQSFGN